MRKCIFVSSRRRRKDAARNWRVLLNGLDVTGDCQDADSRLGYALLVLRDDSGRAYLNQHRELARVVARGSVRFIRDYRWRERERKAAA